MMRRLAHKPLAMVSLAWIVILILASVFAPLIAPYAPDEQDIANAFAGPSSQHWLGTGELGLDVLSRLLYGGRITLLSTLISVTVYVLVGVPLGLIAGYRGGWIDRIILRFSEVAMAVPGAVIVLVVLAVRPNDETAAMIALGLLAAPGLARVVRSATINVREQLYIRAARVSGLRDLVILREHILPNVLPTVIVHVALFATAAIGLETGLGFLGVGTKQVTWGQLVAEASNNLSNQPWLLVPSGFLIISFILALGLLGDGVRDATAEGPAGGGAKRPRARRVRRLGQVLPQSSQPIGEVGKGTLMVVRGLTVAFDDAEGEQVTVVQDVSFTVGRGEKFGIVGESGSGKSVTTAALLALLQGSGRVLGGTMWFDGTEYDLRDSAALSALRGRRIGLIGQNPMSGLDPCFTVGSQLAETVKACTSIKDKAKVRARVLELLGTVQLPDPEEIAACYPHQLSGGMAQRVGIAAALAGQPAMLLADEPTTAIDVTVQAEILDVLRELDAAVVLVTHDWGVLADLCGRAVVMYAGEVVEEGTVPDLVARPHHPYTVGLLRSNPHFATAHEPLPAIPGTVPPPGAWGTGCHFASRCPIAEDRCRAEAIPLVSSEGTGGLTRCIKQRQVGRLEPQAWSAAARPVDDVVSAGTGGTGGAR